jgi:hypothetical protein
MNLIEFLAILESHTGYPMTKLPEARVTKLILNDIRKTRDAGY